MAKTQERPLASPKQYGENLEDAFVVIQANLESLFGDAHTHQIRTTAPAASEGKIGDIIPVETGGTTKLYVKYTSGWKSVSLF